MADTLDLGSSAVRCAGSSPVPGNFISQSFSWAHGLRVDASSGTNLIDRSYAKRFCNGGDNV